jgi:xanthine dehydrogenase YagR molybdenum-binding subunit
MASSSAAAYDAQHRRRVLRRLRHRAVGVALHEDTVFDERLGRVVNGNLAEYHVPVQADVPAIDVSWIDAADERANPIGAKDIGEIGITGAAAAVASAVYHATGRRVRDLPITLDKLL